MRGFLKVVTPQLLRYLVPVPLSHRQNRHVSVNSLTANDPNNGAFSYPSKIPRHCNGTTETTPYLYQAKTQNSILTVKANLHHHLLLAFVFRLPRPLTSNLSLSETLTSRHAMVRKCRKAKGTVGASSTYMQLRSRRIVYRSEKASSSSSCCASNNNGVIDLEVIQY